MVKYQDTALDRTFAALADPTRRALLARLGDQESVSVSELAAPLEMSLAAVVQHVQVLEASRLVNTRKDGRVRTCRIDPTAFATAESWLSARRMLWEQRLDRLGALLAEGEVVARKSIKRKERP